MKKREMIKLEAAGTGIPRRRGTEASTVTGEPVPRPAGHTHIFIDLTFHNIKL